MTILREQGFHYLRFIFSKLYPDINLDSPENLFLDITNDLKKHLLLLKEKDFGYKGEITIFGDDNLSLKQIFYFSNIKNYSKPLFQIEQEVEQLANVVDIVEDDINNSFFNHILTDEEKNNLYKGNFDKELSKHLYIKSKKYKRFSIPLSKGREIKK